MTFKVALLYINIDSFSFSIPLYVLTIMGFVIASGVTYFAIPILVKGAVYKNLYAETNGRVSHNTPIPALGGVGVFAGFILSVTVVAGTYFNFELAYLLTGLIVIFIVGLKDDLMGGKPWKKLLGQIIATLIICFLADIRITNFRGFLGIWEIHYPLSLGFTVFTLVVIINAINLIDGIDGLASGIGIMASSVLGLWFYVTENTACTVMCSALAGSLLVFFIFNVFGKKNKIFLGDTGSLTSGLILGVLAVRFLQLEPSAKGLASINSSPAVAMSLFILPFFDTLRVMLIRIGQHKSPFHADHQHIHHQLLELGLSHFQSTLILISINLFLILLCYFLQDIGNILLIVTQFFIATLLSYVLLLQVKKKAIK
jgi:UDP-N-acetylmuramyl pentapeptide phosphotransferase/UDP-N-acetylglucosamine-1-phosphate transferase